MYQKPVHQALKTIFPLQFQNLGGQLWSKSGSTPSCAGAYFCIITSVQGIASGFSGLEPPPRKP
jgi:hypothetical protein